MILGLKEHGYTKIMMNTEVIGSEVWYEMRPQKLVTIVLFWDTDETGQCGRKALQGDIWAGTLYFW